MRARFDLDDRRGSPFPSDRFTVADANQNTGLRVALPKPDCAVRPNDCFNLDVINTLDGFNVQPRLSIPFDGAIDVTSVSSQTVFLVSVGSTLPGGDPGGKVIGINQVVRDVTTTLHAESERDSRSAHTLRADCDPWRAGHRWGSGRWTRPSAISAVT